MTIRRSDHFDDFRKERQRMRAKLGPATSALGYENQALRELEQVEAREVRDQQLTREVHEFFATATRQAAGIVEKVARDAQAQTGARVEQEMEAFLIDALARMNTLVVTLLQQRRGQVAEAQVEPKVGNLVGESLDEFRWEGTAEVGDKHIGQDPFDTDVDEVRKEFRAQIGGLNAGEGAAPDAMPIEQHLVAAVQQEDPQDERETPSGAAEDLPAVPSAPARPAKVAAGNPSPKESQPTPEGELDRFKEALKALVRQGTMTREEARAAWETRLKALGHKS